MNSKRKMYIFLDRYYIAKWFVHFIFSFIFFSFGINWKSRNETKSFSLVVGSNANDGDKNWILKRKLNA